VRAFHLEAASRFLERGWLRLHALRFRGEVAAVLYCFLCRGTLYYYGGGFDPYLARLSPGTVLTGHAMAEAVREGAAEFDFLRGDEPYKYAWGAADRHNQRLVISRGALPQAWVRLEERVEAAVKGAIRRSLAAGRGPKAGPQASTDVAPPI
jgi:CelD/BcsL family acetyltransferase involved in cellulose biosynthesis